MTPIEVLKGSIDPKTLRGLEGRKVYGVVYYEPDEKKEVLSLGDLGDKLVEILTSGYPEGFHKSEKSRNEWEGWRAREIERWGDEALISLFSNEGHMQITTLINCLGRHGIRTIPQLIEEGKNISRIRGIGSTGVRQEAAAAIVNYFEGK